MTRLWIVHRTEKVVRKVFWTGILLVPVFGWLAYGGLFHISDRSGAESFGENFPGSDNSSSSD